MAWWQKQRSLGRYAHPVTDRSTMGPRFRALDSRTPFCRLDCRSHDESDSTEYGRLAGQAGPLTQKRFQALALRTGAAPSRTAVGRRPEELPAQLLHGIGPSGV